MKDGDTCITQALSGRRRTLGDDHPETLFSIRCLGVLRRMQEDLAGAEVLLEEALTRQSIKVYSKVL